MGSSPTVLFYANIAQKVEQWLNSLRDTGSIPVICTMENKSPVEVSLPAKECDGNTFRFDSYVFRLEVWQSGNAAVLKIVNRNDSWVRFLQLPRPFPVFFAWAGYCIFRVSSPFCE